MSLGDRLDRWQEKVEYGIGVTFDWLHTLLDERGASYHGRYRQMRAHRALKAMKEDDE